MSRRNSKVFVTKVRLALEVGEPGGVLWERQKLQTRGTQYVLALAEKEAVFFKLNHVM